jgi:hypothetical protein
VDYETSAGQPRRTRGPAGADGSPAGLWRPLSRAEIAAKVPPGSRRARSQKEFLEHLGEDPELAQLRADRLRNIAEVARILARYASWTDRTTRPTRALICRLAGISVSTWKVCRAWLEQRYLGTVRQGRTPMLRAGVLVADDAPNEAAVYVLCVPRRKPSDQPPKLTKPVTRPLPPSRSEGCLPHARAREAIQAEPLRAGPGRKLTDEHVAAIGRPFLRAGWTAADLRHALDHPPSGLRHTMRISGVRSPAHWLAWRLSRWTTEPDVCWQAFRELGRWAYLPAPVPLDSPSARAWRDAVPVGQVYLAESRRRAAAAARIVGEHPVARALREQLGWKRRPTEEARSVRWIHYATQADHRARRNGRPREGAVWAEGPAFGTVWVIPRDVAERTFALVHYHPASPEASYALDTEQGEQPDAKRPVDP